jgi:divalent metal cation (Fe/Co/Zn/Cd) transporter
VAVTTESAANRSVAVRRGLRLEYLTIGYNSLEGVIALVAGFLAGSIALVGFGFDSAIEVSSGMVLLWRLGQDTDPARRRVVERRALRLVGLSFLALAAYVLYESVESLIRRQAPDESLPGILLATASLIVMPLLARAKRRVARAIESGALSADARQTELCFYLSAILLGGLLLNSLLGWWWADPAAALAMVPLIAHEGIDAFKGEGCGCAPSH